MGKCLFKEDGDSLENHERIIVHSAGLGLMHFLPAEKERISIAKSQEDS